MSSGARRMASNGMIFLILGIAAFAAGSLVVNAATTSEHSASAAKKKRGKKKASMQIRTQVTGQLAPGRSVPLEVSLANNRPVNLWVTRLIPVIRLDAAHVAAGCSATRDYRVTLLPRKFFPYKLSRVKRKKSQLKRAPKVKWNLLRTSRTNGHPMLSMVSLPGVNQDACKGATLTISWKTRITTKKPRSRKATKR